MLTESAGVDEVGLDVMVLASYDTLLRVCSTVCHISC